MKINIIASTKVGYELPKEEAVNFSGKSAGICYLPDTLDVLFNDKSNKMVWFVIFYKCIYFFL